MGTIPVRTTYIVCQLIDIQLIGFFIFNKGQGIGQDKLVDHSCLT